MFIIKQAASVQWVSWYGLYGSDEQTLWWRHESL